MLPVKFSILVVFTVNAITFQPPVIDFGSIFHKGASKVNITMTNHSLLPQQFSFVRLPKEISVSTDDGTGHILPGENYKLQVEYRPSQGAVYEESFIVRFQIVLNILFSTAGRSPGRYAAGSLRCLT